MRHLPLLSEEAGVMTSGGARAGCAIFRPPDDRTCTGSLVRVPWQVRWTKASACSTRCGRGSFPAGSRVRTTRASEPRSELTLLETCSHAGRSRSSGARAAARSAVSRPSVNGSQTAASRSRGSVVGSDHRLQVLTEIEEPAQDHLEDAERLAQALSTSEYGAYLMRVLRDSPSAAR